MIFQPQKTVKTDLSDYVLKRGRTASFRFTGEGLSEADHHRLYFTCEDRMHFALKDEPQTERLYMMIDDSLDTEHTRTRRYCLDLSCKTAKPIAKRATTKIKWTPPIASLMKGVYDDVWELGIWAQANNLVIEEGGYLQICLERWDKKPGINPLLTKEAPDATEIVSIPAGTYDYTFFSKKFEISRKTTACVLITVEGENYSGEIYLEEPTLSNSAGKNACPEFDSCVPNLTEFMWVGQSLSKKEWPELIISINGREIYNDEVFLRIHRYPSVEIEIPDDLVFGEENEITFTYTSHYHDTVPLSIREVEILARPKKLFHITYCPRTAVIGKDVCVLIRTEAENLTLACKSPDFEPVTPLTFAEKGIHAARFRAKKAANHQKLTLACNGVTDTAEILHMAERGEDNVICGSGDMIYINSNDQECVEDYLEWFLEQEMGDLVTVRPCYRWSSHRSIVPAVWKKFCEICNEMDVKYAHMLDGRDLPAIPFNPSLEMMQGKSFLGRQLHERDGQAFYWNYPAFQYIPISNTFWDACQRISRQYPDTVETVYGAGNLIIAERGRGALYHNIDCAADMKSAHESAMDTLNVLRQGGSTRHTGPSVMFKYFYESGFDWCGAETMDSTQEALLAFLRGAAKAYGKDNVGVHHAVQWSTTPHDTEPRYRRFLLALYTSYLQGIQQINTEEGFWHLENGFYNHHRFSDATTRHREQEVRMTRFIRSHTRSGKYYTPIAILHGRYDGWNGFIGQRLWGMPHMLVGEAEKSWQLLKVFYPLDRIELSGMCVTGTSDGPEGKDDKPRGMYSGTPRGNVDVMPVECGDYSDYKLLAFLSYNAAEKSDFDRLEAYVRKGGTLLLGWPHMATTTNLADIQAYRQHYLYHPIMTSLTCGAPVFETRTLNGQALSVCVNVAKDIEVLQTTDDGTPLVYAVKMGEGRVILINSKLYAANEIIRPVYEKVLSDLQAALAAEEHDEMSVDVDVQYTVFAQDDGARHYYVTPVDWYNQPDFKRHASLRVGEQHYGIDIDFGTIFKVVVKGDVAAYAVEDTAEVLSVSESAVRVQGVDVVTVHILKDGVDKVVMVDCTDEPSRTIEL